MGGLVSTVGDLPCLRLRSLSWLGVTCLVAAALNHVQRRAHHGFDLRLARHQPVLRLWLLWRRRSHVRRRRIRKKTTDAKHINVSTAGGSGYAREPRCVIELT